MTQLDNLYRRLYKRYITDPTAQGLPANMEAFNQAWGWTMDKMNAASIEITKQLEQTGWV